MTPVWIIRVVAYALTIGYAIVFGHYINTGDVWAVAITTILGMIAFSMSVFMLWVSTIEEK